MPVLFSDIKNILVKITAFSEKETPKIEIQPMQSNSLGLPLAVVVKVSRYPTNPINLIVKTDFAETGSSIGLYSDYEEYGS